MDKGKILSILVILSSFALAGCPKDTKINIYNNSNKDVYVVFKDGNVIWLDNSILKLDSGAMNRMNFINRSDGFYVPLLNLVIGQEDVVYELIPSKPIPYTYYDDKNWLVTTRFQLEGNGLLYCIRADQEFPLRDLSDQPEGCPIKPAGRF